MSIEIIKRFEFYKMDHVTNGNDFILYDKKIKHSIIGTKLINLYDIVKDREPHHFYKLLMSNLTLEEIKKIPLETLKVNMLVQQKTLFDIFKNLVLLNKTNIQNITYAPIEKRTITKKNIVYFNNNTFSCKFKPVEKESYNFPHLKFLMENIFGEGYFKFIHLLAWKKQEPLKQIPCHFVINDNGGTGKTEFIAGDIVGNLFPVNIVTQTELEQPFNSYMSKCQFVIFEEVEGYKDEKKLKALTGSKTLMINDKNEKLYKIDNSTTIIINSNEIKSVKISQQDRRFNIVGGGKRLSALTSTSWDETLFGSKEENEKFFKSYAKDLNKELEELNSYLHYLKIDRVAVQTPLDNKFKQDLISINSTSESVFLEELKSEGIKQIIDEHHPRGLNNFLDNYIIIKDNEAYILKKGLYNLYNTFCKDSNFKQSLSKNHFFKRLKTFNEYKELFKEGTKRIFHNNKQIRVLTLKNIIEKEPLNDLEAKEIKL